MSDRRLFRFFTQTLPEPGKNKRESKIVRITESVST